MQFPPSHPPQTRIYEYIGEKTQGSLAKLTLASKLARGPSGGTEGLAISSTLTGGSLEDVDQDAGDVVVSASPIRRFDQLIHELFGTASRT
jgi:hypothetical protein